VKGVYGGAQQNSLVDGTVIQRDNLTSVNNSSVTMTNIIAVDFVPLSADSATTTSATRPTLSPASPELSATFP